MEFDDIQPLWKDATSNVGNCPSLSKVDGGFIAVGARVGEKTAARINATFGIAQEEVAIFIPDNVLDRLRDTA